MRPEVAKGGGIAPADGHLELVELSLGHGLRRLRDVEVHGLSARGRGEGAMVVPELRASIGAVQPLVVQRAFVRGLGGAAGEPALRGVVHGVPEEVEARRRRGLAAQAAGEGELVLELLQEGVLNVPEPIIIIMIIIIITIISSSITIAIIVIIIIISSSSSSSSSMIMFITT